MRHLLLTAMAVVVPAVVALSQQSGAPQAARVTVERSKVGTMRTDLGSGAALNDGSTLPREAITIHDATMPVELEKIVFLSTHHANSQLHFKAEYFLRPKEDLSAVEVRFLLFDVFGDRLRTLSQTVVADMIAGKAVTTTPTWTAWPENEAAQFYG